MRQPLPLPTGLAGVEASPYQQEVVRNCIYSNGKLKGRPVVDNYLNFGESACRGLGLIREIETGDELLYGVWGNTLKRITIINPQFGKRLNAGDVLVEDVYDQIAGQAQVQIVGDFSRACVMVVGGSAYIYEVGTKSVSEITDSSSTGYLPSVSVAVDDGRFVFAPEDGSPFFFSKLQDPADIEARFFDAETRPDPNKGLYVRRGLLYGLGTRSIEALDYNPTANIYRRISQNTDKVGYVTCLTQYGDSFAYLGQGDNGGYGFYIHNTQAERISNEAVDEILNKNYYERELRDLEATYFVWEGTPVAVFLLPRHTLVYYGGWAVWQTGTTGQELKTWRVNDVQYAYGYYWTGDSVDGSVGNLVYNNLEFGEPVESLIETYANFGANTNNIVNNIYLDVTTGTAPDTRLSMSVSNENKFFGEEDWRDLGAEGDYTKSIRLGPPVGRFPRFMGLRIQWYGSVSINVDGVEFD